MGLSGDELETLTSHYVDCLAYISYSADYAALETWIFGQTGDFLLVLDLFPEQVIWTALHAAGVPAGAEISVSLVHESPLAADCPCSAALAAHGIRAR